MNRIIYAELAELKFGLAAGRERVAGLTPSGSLFIDVHLRSRAGGAGGVCPSWIDRSGLCGGVCVQSSAPRDSPVREPCSPGLTGVARRMCPCHPWATCSLEMRSHSTASAKSLGSLKFESCSGEILFVGEHIIASWFCFESDSASTRRCGPDKPSRNCCVGTAYLSPIGRRTIPASSAGHSVASPA